MANQYEAWSGHELKILRTAVVDEGMQVTQIVKKGLLPGRSYMALWKQIKARTREGTWPVVACIRYSSGPTGIRTSCDNVWETPAATAAWYKANNDRAVEAMRAAGFDQYAYGGERPA